MTYSMYLSKGMWGQFSTYLFIDRKLDSSKRNRNGTKSRFFKLCKLFEGKPLTRENLNLVMQEMTENDYSASYKNNLIKLVKHIVRYYNIEGFDDYTYFKAPTQHFVDIFTPDDIKTIAEFNYPYKRDREKINYKLKTLYYFLSITGCRIGEAIGLKWEDFYTDYVLFRETKNGDQRAVPIPLFVTQLITNLPRETEYVFNILDASHINDDLKHRCEKLGIVKKQISVHVFRHSFVTTMLRKNEASITQISKIVGHKSLESTQIYTHMVIEDLRLAQSMHPLCREKENLESISIKIANFINSLLEGTNFRQSVVNKKTLLTFSVKGL